MSYPVYYVPAGDVLPVMFASYDGATGASEAISGLAVTDIEIYKDGSVTQRASDAGYTLLDTDGIDFDGIAGINGFSIDTGDNTDASFYTVGAWFTVVVSSITADAQTVNFIACQFRIMAAEGVAGVPDANTTHVADTSQTARDLGATLGVAGAGLTAVPWNASWDAEVQSEVNDGLVAFFTSAAQLVSDVWAAAARTLTAVDEDSTTLDLDATIRAAVGLTAANLDTQLGAIDDFLDTEIAAILEDTGTTLDDFIDTEIAAILAKTNSLTFTVAGEVNANTRYVAGTELGGTGTTGDEWGPA